MPNVRHDAAMLVGRLAHVTFWAITLLAVAAAPVLFALWISGDVLAQTPSHAQPANITCPGDHVVWVNTRSGVYHFKGERYFGSTREGKFTCQHDADKEGDRPTRNGQ